jgi:hypothetical protein
LAFFRGTIWLNRWKWQRSCCTVFQFRVTVKHSTRSEAINNLRSSKYYLLRVCVLILALVITECKSYLSRATLYCHLSPGWPFHYLINEIIFEKKKVIHKIRVLIFSETSVWNIPHCTKNWASYHTRSYVFNYSARYSCYILMKPELSRHIFDKYSYIIFHENHSSGGTELFHAGGRADGRTDGRTNMTKLAVALRHSANTSKTTVPCQRRVFLYFVWLSQHTVTHPYS